MILVLLRLLAGSARGKGSARQRAPPVLSSATNARETAGSTLGEQVARALVASVESVKAGRDPQVKTPTSRGSLKSPLRGFKTPHDAGCSSATKVVRPPNAPPRFAASDPDVVTLFKEIARAIPLELSKGSTAAGMDSAATTRVLKKLAPLLLESFAKLKAVSRVQAKWWNITAKFANKILGVEIMPLSNDALSQIGELVPLFRHHVTAVKCVDDNSSSVSPDAAWMLGWKTGSPPFWQLMIDGKQRKQLMAQIGHRRQGYVLGLSGDAAQLNRVIAQTSHHICSINGDPTDIRDTPRVMNCLIFLLMNQVDHRKQIENHAGDTPAYVRYTTKLVGGDLRVPFVEVSFEAPFEGSSLEKVHRFWTAANQIKWLRVNGFIQGNFQGNWGDPPLAPRIAEVLDSHHRLVRMLVGRALRVIYFGSPAAGGLKAALDDQSELPWDANVISIQINNGTWVSPSVLDALMDTAQDAHEAMVRPLVIPAITSTLIDEMRILTDVPLMSMTTALYGISLNVTEYHFPDVGTRVVLIGDDSQGLWIGDVVESTFVNGVTKEITSAKDMHMHTREAVQINFRRVLDEEGLANLRLCIADANPGPLSRTKVFLICHMAFGCRIALS